MALIHRVGLGRNLTAAEVDANFDGLDARLAALEAGTGTGTTTTTTVTVTGTTHSGTVGTAYTAVTFTAAGGSAPYTYTVAGSLPAGLTLNPSSGVLSGTPTTAGTSSFMIHAVDASSVGGNSSLQSVTIAAAASSPSPTPAPAPTTTVTVPGAPTGLVATAGNTNASVAFTAPASNGGAAITSYVITSSTGQQASGSGSPILVSGLTNGTGVTFTAHAVNSAGNSAESTASNLCTPTAGTASASNLRFTSIVGNPTESGDASNGWIYTGGGGQYANQTALKGGVPAKLASGQAGTLAMTVNTTSGGSQLWLTKDNSANGAADDGAAAYGIQVQNNGDGCTYSVFGAGTFRTGQLNDTGAAHGAAGQLCGVDVNSGGTVYTAWFSTDGGATKTTLDTFAGRTAGDLYPRGAIYSAGVLSKPTTTNFA